MSRAAADALRLYLVVGGLDDDALLAVADAALRGGVRCVQLREKTLGTRDFVARAQRLLPRLRQAGVPLIINDRLDVALACGADGVHVGQDDMPVDMVRRHLPRALVGLSVGSLDELDAGQALEVDYFSPSPLFATRSKPDAGVPLGLATLRAMRARCAKPLVPIGGIDAGNAAAVFAAGADGIAVVSAIVGVDDPCAASSRLAAIARASAGARHGG